MKPRPTRMSVRLVTLPVDTWARIEFLRETVHAYNDEEIIIRAIKILDQIMGPLEVEGSVIELVHKDGSRDRIT